MTLLDLPLCTLYSPYSFYNRLSNYRNAQMTPVDNHLDLFICFLIVYVILSSRFFIMVFYQKI